MEELARRLTALSAREMVAALGVREAPDLVRRGLALPFLAASAPLGRKLARFDAGVSSHGLPSAARRSLLDFGISLRASGHLGEGPRLVLSNHPGAYDALALMSVLGRRDLRILAADREFLRALPHLAPHLSFVAEGKAARAGSLKRAIAHLRAGGALLHFPAGCIEPDADFEPPGAELLAPWQPGVTALLAACHRSGGRVAVAGVRGVHSPRAKRWRVNRWAEARGITTLSPLLQMVAGLRDVVTRVHVHELELPSDLAPDAKLTQLREQLQAAILRA